MTVIVQLAEATRRFQHVKEIRVIDTKKVGGERTILAGSDGFRALEVWSHDIVKMEVIP